jgi:spermidine synthase
MTDENPTADHATSAAPRWLFLLLLLFFGSGCAALIYEIVWFQLLQLVVGSTAVSLGVVLGTFMGGMCLGSFALPRVVSAQKHPLRVYALMEAAIGLIAILVLLGLPAIGGLYAAAASGMAFRGSCFAESSVRPVPAAAHAVDGRHAAGHFPLGRNHTAGESPGWVSSTAATLWARYWGRCWPGFYLLRLYGTATATFVAVAINVTVAGVALHSGETDALSACHCRHAAHRIPPRPMPAPAWSMSLSRCRE